MIIQNLSNDAVHTYSDNASMLHAVCHSWAEENNRVSQWSQLAHGDASVADYMEAGFPVVIGSVSIACGDWAAI